MGSVPRRAISATVERAGGDIPSLLGRDAPRATAEVETGAVAVGSCPAREKHDLANRSVSRDRVMDWCGGGAVHRSER
jgi:hypothetical protein